MFSDEFSADFGHMSRSVSGMMREGDAVIHEKREGARGATSFWQSVAAFERAPHTTHFDQLIRAGVTLPEPSKLSDGAVAAKLWEVIEHLALLRVFLRHTDHLSDRDLYELLWWELLRQDTVDTTHLPETRCHLDILGGRDQMQRYLYLKFYADEQERRFFSEQYPDSDLPKHQDPPFQRDTRLPSA